MNITTAMQAALDSGAFEFAHLIWIKAKNRSTGAIEAAGFHTGLDDFTITINGESRTYSGIGHVIKLPDFTSVQGLGITEHDLELAILAPEVANAIRAYDSDLAPIDVNLAIFNAAGDLAGTSTIVKGFINGIKISSGPDEQTCTISVASNIQQATRGLTLKNSHQSQQLIDPTDEGFKYAAVAGTTEIKWGNENGQRKVKSMRRQRRTNV